MVVSVAVREGIARVTIDNPPVNALSRAVRAGLAEAAASLSTRADVQAVLLTGAGRAFIAGADVTEFDAPPQPPHLPDVIRAIETCAKPFAAFIDGACLGGGLEVALGCRWRIGTAKASLGLPEVTLGVIPGAGGTVRTPRLIGVEAAVDLATGGSPLTADKALSLGLLDAVVADEAEAEAWLRTAVAGDWPAAVADRAVSLPDAGFWAEAASRIARTAKGNTAPAEALARIRAAAEGDFDSAMAAERDAFMRLRDTDQARALRHVFFAERAAPRPPEVRGVTARPVHTIGIVGGGTMGAGIAVAALNAGLTVRMVERDAASAERGAANVAAILDADRTRGRITDAQQAEQLARFAAARDYASLADCDLVIEAVFEDLAVKQAVFKELSAACRPDAILATNTSYIDPRTIFAGLPHPERAIGLHFFSPANVMKLLEIVPLPDTAPKVLATAFAVAARLKKIPVRAGICDGFIGNRILKLYREQGERLIAAGASPDAIDAALTDFGMAMGLYAVQDLAGLDIGAAQRQAARARGEAPFAPVADRLAAMGRLGRKTGAGWYDYDGGKPRPGPLPAPVTEAIAAVRAETDLPQRAWTAAEITDALILPMVSEAAQIVADGIALRPEDVDLVMVHGYGFPRVKGGPVQYGRALGIAEVVRRLEALHAQGLAPAPAAALREWS